MSDAETSTSTSPGHTSEKSGTLGKVMGIIALLLTLVAYPILPYGLNFVGVFLVLVFATIGAFAGEKMWTSIATIMSPIMFVVTNPMTMTLLSVAASSGDSDAGQASRLLGILALGHLAPFAAMLLRAMRRKTA